MEQTPTERIEAIERRYAFFMDKEPTYACRRELFGIFLRMYQADVAALLPLARAALLGAKND